MLLPTNIIKFNQAKQQTRTFHRLVKGSGLNALVRLMGLEPIRLPTRPSNVRVCLFRHSRVNIHYYTHKIEFVNTFFNFIFHIIFSSYFVRLYRNHPKKPYGFSGTPLITQSITPIKRTENVLILCPFGFGNDFLSICGRCRLDMI